MSNAMLAMTREERDEARLTLRKGEYNRVVVDVKAGELRFLYGEKVIFKEQFGDLEVAEIMFRGVMHDFRVNVSAKSTSLSRHGRAMPDLTGFPISISHSR